MPRPFAEQTTFGVGGRPLGFAEPRTIDELRACLDEAASSDDQVFILGAGSNILAADGELPLRVIKPRLTGITCRGAFLHAASGEAWDDVVAFGVAHGLQGIECLSGIPGTVGAAPVQNIGAYGQQLCDVVETIEVVDRDSGSSDAWFGTRCEFGYRSSFFKRHPSRFIITGVTLRLAPHAAPCRTYNDISSVTSVDSTLSDVRTAVINARRSKGMLMGQTRSAGSFFVNPVVDAEDADRLRSLFPALRHHPELPGGRSVKLPAAALIEASGFMRGYRDGSVGLSDRHALSIVTYPGARASDVIRLAENIQDGVVRACGVLLEPEVRLIGFPPGTLRIRGAVADSASTR